MKVLFKSSVTKNVSVLLMNTDSLAQCSSYEESFMLLKFLIASETQNRKNNLKEKLYDVLWEEKMSISEVSRFLILPYTWNWKLGNIGKFSFTSIFIVSVILSMGKVKTFQWISNQQTSCPHVTHQINKDTYVKDRL